MEYQSLYRKYRPTSFEEISGQDVAKKILKNSIIANKLSHAYLFYGPRGTGKTSIAKMFARICNCLENKNGECCNKCENCIESKEKPCVDIVEIDAASNNGVDEIRELKNKINLVPNKLKYKVYIIDEVHMLSIGAFNALLKTLEEPPEHVIFILATTEFQKVPSTIVSRCQNIEFKNVGPKEMFDRLTFVSNNENINISNEALNQIIMLSNGSLRDAIGLLQKADLYVEQGKKIELLDIQNSYGMISNNEVDELYNILEKNKIMDALEKIHFFLENGKDIIQLLNQLLYKYRQMILEDFDSKKIEKIKLISTYQEKIKKSLNQSILLEILIIELCDKTNVREEKEPVKQEKVKIAKENKTILDIKSKNIRINNTFAKADKNILSNVKEKWIKLKEFVFDQKIGALCCDLADTTPIVCSLTNLMVCTEYYSTIEKINKNFEIYENILKEKLGLEMKLIAVTVEEWKNLKNDYINNIKNNIPYTYVDENQANLNKLEQKPNIINKEKDNNDSINILDKAKELFGELSS